MRVYGVLALPLYGSMAYRESGHIAWAATCAGERARWVCVRWQWRAASAPLYVLHSHGARTCLPATHLRCTVPADGAPGQTCQIRADSCAYLHCAAAAPFAQQRRARSFQHSFTRADTALCTPLLDKLLRPLAPGNRHAWFGLYASLLHCSHHLPTSLLPRHLFTCMPRRHHYRLRAGGRTAHNAGSWAAGVAGVGMAGAGMSSPVPYPPATPSPSASLSFSNLVLYDYGSTMCPAFVNSVTVFCNITNIAYSPYW